jgi:Tfp pilus assembly protein PilO
MADNALTKLTLGGQLLVSVVLGAVIFGGFYFFWLSDAWKEEATKKAKREALQKEIRALEVTANKLQEFQREVQLLEAKLDTLKRILPPEKETPDLMRRVQALAAQSFLSVKIHPTAWCRRTSTRKAHQDGAHGELPQPGLFPTGSRLSRLVNVKNLKVKT